MSKAFEKIMAGLEDAMAYAKGDASTAKLHAPALKDVDVRKLRERLGVSQSEFAAVFNLPIATIKNWEQGRRHPEGPAKALLMVIDHSPEAVFSAIHMKGRDTAKTTAAARGGLMLLRREKDATWSTVEKNPRRVRVTDLIDAKGGLVAAKRARIAKASTRPSARVEARK
ncbi:MAG: helix-turn-helix domain-containing protein [Clostridia bacterium]|nr:helix-turn-helix domain-containing protein [Deltaproteobacteria bacterium]